MFRAISRCVAVGLSIAALMTSALAQANWPATNSVAVDQGRGRAVAVLDDIDGDGFNDLLVGLQTGGDASLTPRAVIYSGASNQIILSVNGPVGSGFGVLVAGVGDVDGDGITDFAVREDLPFSFSGTFRIYAGATGALLRVHSGQRYLSASIDAVDDIDGDGRDDYVIGIPRGGTGGAELISGATGLPIRSWAVNGGFGAAVTTIDDIDGDGLVDLAIGRPFANATLGATTTGEVQLVSSVTGATVRTISAPAGSLQFGDSLCTLGDLDGDGFRDLVIGASGEGSLFNNGPGSAFVASLATGNILHDITAVGTTGGYGRDLATGDFDLDGVDDIVVATRTFNTFQGRIYVFSGATGEERTALTGAGPSFVTEFGHGVAAGDLNGDGISEICICENFQAGNPTTNQGLVSIRSAPAPFAPSILPTVTTATLSTVTGTSVGQEFGGSLAALGDTDGDGIDDFAVGSPAPSGGTVEILSGDDQSTLLTISGSGPGFGSIIGTAGDLNGDGATDVAVAGAGASPSGIDIHSGSTGAVLTTLAVPGDVIAFERVEDLGGVSTSSFLVLEQRATPDHQVFQLIASGGSTLWSLTGAVGAAFGNNWLVVPDRNGDGTDDVVVASYGASALGELITLSGLDGSILSTLQLTFPFPSTFNQPLVTIEDRDGDGQDDYVFGAATFITGGFSRIDFVSSATGAVIQRLIDPLGTMGFGRFIEKIQDIDGDGFSELAVSSNTHIAAISGADGSVMAAHSPTGASAMARVSDVDGDGIRDLAVGSSHRSSPALAFNGAVDVISIAAPVINPVAGGTPVASDLLIAEAAGTVGVGHGGPYAVLTAQGSAGGVQRAITVGVGAPFSIRMREAPVSNGPRHFAIFGRIGVPAPSEAIAIPSVGTLLFAPAPFAPQNVALFTLAETYLSPTIGLVPATPGDWSMVSQDGIPIAVDITFQGICDDPEPGKTSTTNAIVLRVM